MSSRINPGNTQDRTGGEHKKRQGRNGKNHEKNRKNQKKAMAFSGSSPVRPLGGTGCRTEPASLRERCRLSFLPEVFYGGTVCVAMAYKKKQKENPRGRKSANRQVGGKGKGRRKRRPGRKRKRQAQKTAGEPGEGPVSRTAGEPGGRARIKGGRGAGGRACIKGGRGAGGRACIKGGRQEKKEAERGKDPQAGAKSARTCRFFVSHDNPAPLLLADM